MLTATRIGRLDRSWRAGLLVGAAVGIAGGYLGRRAERASRPGLVDWRRAESIAASRLRRAPGALTPAEIAAAGPAYAAIMDRIVPLLEVRLGQPLPGVVERHEVIDRAGWAAASRVTFEALLQRLEAPLLDQLRARRGAVAGLATLANRFLTTQQVGFLLGYLGTRVLGQYDVALLAAEGPPGRLLFVEENIRLVAAQLGVPLDRMRLWIALHETTHAFEFEAHPWLRAYLAERLERQLASFLEEADGLRVEGLGRLLRRIRDVRGGDLLGAFLTAEQRRLLAETQLLMSLLEGFSDWVMDDVGRQVLPDIDGIRERFEARRGARRRGLDRLVSRLIGLDLKLEQYHKGERFVAGVHALGGEPALARLWDGPASLPSQAELDDPRLWVARMTPA
ncbi:MAG TPA: zinc-dependent metalloprotease [Candidatus Limnocylindrales bacterium]|nr:zinc-dependent metalloprotease [Candidatus Limnocylindrales bacterium]